MQLGDTPPHAGVDEHAGVRSEVRRLVGRTGEELRRNGWRKVASEAAKFAQSQVACRVLPSCRHPATFDSGPRRLPYVRRPYNHAWRNERSVELALAYDFVSRTQPRRLLEVGNVLRYYRRFACRHDVIDRYELAPGVINEDIETWSPAEPYDALLSVSTLEHVGWDDEPRDEEKVARVLARLDQLVVPGGPVLVTVPLGHNRFLDRLLADGAVTFPEERWFYRTGRRNDWELCSKRLALATPYDRRAASAGAIFVGEHGPTG